MRHSRPLTKGENWELAILLMIMVGVLLAITLVWRLSRVPHLWALMPPRVAMAVSNTRNAIAAENAIPHAAPTAAIRDIPHIAVPPKARLDIQPRPTVRPRRIAQAMVRHVDSYWFHGHRYVYWKTLILRVTSYAPDRRCCWPYPGTTTASGASVWTNDGHLVAADTRLIPFHCMVRVPGYDYDHPVPVLDRGEAIHGYRLDVLAPTFWSAQHWGVKLLRVKIYRPVARW